MHLQAEAGIEFNWAEATFAQACFDFLNGGRIFKAKIAGTNALAMAQFQQCVEKSLKSMVLVEMNKRQGAVKEVILTHRVWRERIGHEQPLRAIRDRVLNALGTAGENDILSLESNAPTGTTEIPNTEYPWSEEDYLWVPAEYFNEQGAHIDKCMGIARALIFSAADFHPRLGKVKNSVERFVGPNCDSIDVEETA